MHRTNVTQTNRGAGGGQVMGEQAKHQEQILAAEKGAMVHILACVHMEKEHLKQGGSWRIDCGGCMQGEQGTYVGPASAQCPVWSLSSLV